jgi:hypothetical protein
MSRLASSVGRGRGPERRTTGVPAPKIALASRLLFLSQWSRRTGLNVVVARGSAAKRASFRERDPGGAVEGEGWMPDEDSNLD